MSTTTQTASAAADGTPEHRVPPAEVCYRAVASRDRRFDGVFYTGVRSTGIYCRPSCPARTPLLRNVSFHATAAAAQGAGFRACRRCLPDATPDSPAWDVAADTAGRAMRLIADGLVDREGVGGLAGRLGYSPRHLTRLLTHELGAGPLALARAHRAQVARSLLETTDWRAADIAFAAGFASVRQFNDTVREVYDATPTRLRARHRSAPPIATTAGPRHPGRGGVRVAVRVPVRLPFDASALHAFLAHHVVPGVEQAGPDWYARSLRLPHGPAVLRLDLAPRPVGGTSEAGVATVTCTLTLSDVRDVVPGAERCRRLLDAGADPSSIEHVLARGPLADAVRRHRGLRVPGAVDGVELAARTVVGQQVSLAAANRLAGVLVDLAGEELPASLRRDGVDRLFPTAPALAALDPATLPMPRARAATVTALADAVVAGDVVLDRSADRAEVRRSLLAVRGVGPWTADYVLMRALADPDVFLPGDVALRRAVAAYGVEDLDAFATAARPWRSYAVMHLWTDVLDARPAPVTAPLSGPEDVTT